MNVVGTVNVLEAARAAGAHVVFTSTGGAIYGDVERPAVEDDERRPSRPTESRSSPARRTWPAGTASTAVEHVVLRLANVYGPRQSATLEGGVVAIFLERMLRGEETQIFGDGGQTRDFVYVGDVVRACLAAGAHPGGVFNVGTGIETTLVELHRLCAGAAGSDAEPRYLDARPGDARRSVLDVSRAAAELGWRPETSLADGLRLTRESLRKE